MKIAIADIIVTCDNAGTIIENGAVVFGREILDVGLKNELLARYPQAKVYDFGKNSVIMPSLINAHTHLEFCQNSTILDYGNFLDWLSSVISNRERLTSGDLENAIQILLKTMLKQGIGAIGAISSFGLDLTACLSAHQKIVFFNEILGAREERFEAIEKDFHARLERSVRFADERFRPAISLHSPYSTHPILAKKAVQIAKEHDMPIVSHFMESKAERAWLDKNKGDFRLFFEDMFGLKESFWEPQDFLNIFEGTKHGFIHCNYANMEELQAIRYQGGGIVHCPVSNRLLGAKAIDIELLKNLNIDYVIGTDGLSSNFSTSLFDELRAALFVHDSLSLHILAADLLKAVTVNAAALLGLNSGVIQSGLAADIIAIKLPSQATPENVALHTILHTKEVEAIFIDGEQYA